MLHRLFFPGGPLVLPLERGVVPSLVDGAPGRGKQWVWCPLGCCASTMQGACGRPSSGSPWDLEVGVGSVRSTPLLCWLICRTKLLMAFMVSCFPFWARALPFCWENQRQLCELEPSGRFPGKSSLRWSETDGLKSRNSQDSLPLLG